MSTVTIDGIVFRDDAETGRVYTNFPGWYGSPPMRANSVDRPNGDGAFSVSKARRSARVLTFDGALFGSTANAAMELWADFSSVQSSGVPVVITVADEYGTLSVTASLDGVVDVQPLSREAATVTAQFVAYDPIKYGPDRLFVTGLPIAGGGLEYPLHSPAGVLSYGSNGVLGRVTVSNDGTAAVFPRVQIAGGLAAGFFVQRLDTGQVVRYDRVVPDGTTVDIDFRTGSVLVDGESDGSTYLTRAEFFPIEPGESVEVQFNAIAGSSGTPLMTLTSANGFW
jgi:hypothetical protein